jgi:ATP-dependent DNA ligase
MDTAQLTLVRQPFDDPNFLFELKHDSFRALAHIWDGHCELISRRRNSYKSFGELRSHLAGQLRTQLIIWRDNDAKLRALVQRIVPG